MAKARAQGGRRVNSLTDDDAGAPAETTAAAAAAEDEYFPVADDPPPPAKVPARVPVAGRAVISLAVARKLTKKDQANLAQWKTAQRGRALDTFFARQAAEARKKFGHEGVYLGSQTESLVVCIPCPALAFEYVIGQDGFPLGLVLQIVAKHGVGKSALVAEFGRWFDAAGGGTVLCENETKFNPHWYKSILGPEAYARMPLHRCDSVEGWQQHLTFSVKQMQADMDGTKEAPGPGRIFPVMFGVDSIMGKMSRENQEKILGAKSKKKGKQDQRGTTGDGFAQARSFPIEAGSITKYMRTIPQLLDRWPFALVLVNHLRMKQDDAGNQERNKTGGEQVNFQESFELELKKLGGHAHKIAASQFEGVTLQLSCEKNSFGPTGRRARTRLLWWHEPGPGGEDVQKTQWDWDWSTVHLLNNLTGPDSPSTYLKARLKDIGFHIACPGTGEVDNSAWSKSLGMKEKDARPWNEVGAMIREDTGLMTKLRGALGITRRPILAGYYDDQLNAMAGDLP